ncbi:MAG: Zn-dependent hydrolase [Desulfovibrio sp.]|jgi:N-carbamoyl-L-amino-acid hydrolase|nr:Zn-dependent hydrolase [Desulfovibrio sp.]
MPAVNKDRLQEKIHCFAQFGAEEHGGITRLSLSPAALAARTELTKRCHALGLFVETDDIGNIYATKTGTETLPRIAMGSHIDSVIKGGNYDGTLGVLTALEVVETLVRENISTRHPVTVMVWTNEEGARFAPAMMASGVLTGKFSKDAMLAVQDEDGVSFGQALLAGDCLGKTDNRLNPQDYLAYLELHVEQGPVLANENLTIGVVRGVVGMCNYTVTAHGQANHAGTTPMQERKDALYAASQCVCTLYERLGRIDPDLVFTFGHIACRPNIHTIIPDEVRFSLDARHQEPAILQEVVKIVRALPAQTANCAISVEEAWSRKSTLFDPKLVALVKKNADALGFPNRYLYSGAGHDAQYVQDILPSAMIFVPSEGGLSHCAKENTSIDDCICGADVLLHTLLDLDAEDTSIRDRYLSVGE